MSYQEDHAIETFKSLITVSVEGLKTLLLINGGAIVAILAFVGQSQFGSALAASLAAPVILFVVGVLSGTLGFGASYKTQYALLNEHFPERKYEGLPHQTWLRVAFALALVSVVSFSAGAICAVYAIAAPVARPLQANLQPTQAHASGVAATAGASGSASGASR